MTEQEITYKTNMEERNNVLSDFQEKAYSYLFKNWVDYVSAQLLWQYYLLKRYLLSSNDIRMMVYIISSGGVVKLKDLSAWLHKVGIFSSEMSARAYLYKIRKVGLLEYGKIDGNSKERALRIPLDIMNKIDIDGDKLIKYKYIYITKEYNELSKNKDYGHKEYMEQ